MRAAFIGTGVGAWQRFGEGQEGDVHGGQRGTATADGHSTVRPAAPPGSPECAAGSVMTPQRGGVKLATWSKPKIP
ncbi:hypothetical protein GCM10027431_23290 [Lysobacter rhizosphaerae]